ncbi:MAG: EamA family transporter [Chloroflexota bacterium]
MKWYHSVLAVFVAIIWGIAFIASKIALDSFTPPQLTALRFSIASIPAIFVAKPPVPWGMLIPIGLTLFTGQFLFQFFGIANGMPPGLASVIVQTQAFFTVFFAAIVLQERPTQQQQIGILAAFIGLGMIALTVGRGLTGIGLTLTLISAISWAIGNIFVKQLSTVKMFPLMIWLSLVTPLPAMMLSIIQDGPLALPQALMNSSWNSLAALLYLGAVATILAYAIWGELLSRYPTATVAPFALLTPVVGSIASAILFGEKFEVLRLAGMASMVIGLVIAVIPMSTYKS